MIKAYKRIDTLKSEYNRHSYNKKSLDTPDNIIIVIVVKVNKILYNIDDKKETKESI